jgi:hypothetical protein
MDFRTPEPSLFATNLIRLTPEGDLPSDEEKAADYLQSVISCVAAGAARHLIHASGVPIEEWHSEHEGWELDTLNADLLAAIKYVTSDMVTYRWSQVIDLANWLAFVDRVSEPTIWFHDFGRALYRIGNLLGSMLNAVGLLEPERIGFADYHQPSAYKLDDWVSESGYVGALERIWADDTSLHADIHHSLSSVAG